MINCSFRVERGATQSIPFNLFTNESKVARFDLEGKSLKLFLTPIGALDPIFSKTLRTIDAAAGKAALDLSPAESRLIPLGNRMGVEVKLIISAQNQIVVGSGRVTGFGGFTTDT